LAAVRPWASDPERPEGGPPTRPRIDASSHLESTISPLMQPLGHQAGRRVLGEFTVAPVGRSALESGIRDAFAPRFDRQQAAADARVLGPVPLQFAIAHEAAFVGPVLRVGLAVP